MCYHVKGMGFNSKAHAEEWARKHPEHPTAALILPQPAPVPARCQPASEADQAIFQEIVKPAKQLEFVSAYLR